MRKFFKKYCRKRNISGNCLFLILASTPFSLTFKNAFRVCPSLKWRVERPRVPRRATPNISATYSLSHRTVLIFVRWHPRSTKGTVAFLCSRLLKFRSAARRTDSVFVVTGGVGTRIKGDVYSPHNRGRWHSSSAAPLKSLPVIGVTSTSCISCPPSLPLCSPLCLSVCQSLKRFVYSCPALLHILEWVVDTASTTITYVGLVH